MKFSQFNSIIPYQEKFALYNSFNQKVIFILPELKDLLNAAVFEGIDKLEEIHPTFYKYLRDQEYIINSSDDEIFKVKELSKSIDENDTSFYLTINPTMNCNFKCWYCYETHVKQSKLDIEFIDRIKKFISKTVSNNSLDTFSLAFFGGEPLLYFKKNVTPLINYFTEKCHEKNVAYNISFTTNGYLINQEFVDYFKEKNITCALQITLDGYKEEHDLVRFVSATKGSYETIIQNIRLLLQNEFFVRLRINYTDVSIVNTSKIANEFSDIPPEIRDKYLLFDYHRVWQDDKLDDTSTILNENILSIREKGFEVTSGYSPNNVIDSCYADKRNSAVINYNGDVFKCTARDFTTEKRAGYINEIGELVWENDYLEKRMNSKFKNKPCLTCKILPLCNGGCSQHAIEAEEDYCVYFGDENEKDKVVKAKIEEILSVSH
jgi:uncharacterized protein